MLIMSCTIVVSLTNLLHTLQADARTTTSNSRFPDEGLGPHNAAAVGIPSGPMLELRNTPFDWGSPTRSPAQSQAPAPLPAPAAARPWGTLQSPPAALLSDSTAAYTEPGQLSMSVAEPTLVPEAVGRKASTPDDMSYGGEPVAEDAPGSIDARAEGRQAAGLQATGLDSMSGLGLGGKERSVVQEDAEAGPASSKGMQTRDLGAAWLQHVHFILLVIILAYDQQARSCKSLVPLENNK